MKKILFATMLLASTSAFASTDIPIDRVILSTSGLANFVHQTDVDGNAKVEFPVRFEQVDDILKSLVIFDKQGRLGGVTLPGKQPLNQVFKDLPFTRQQLSDPMMLLNAYQGATVTLKDGKVSLSGKILYVTVETEMKNDVAVTRHRISVMTDQGIRQSVVEDLQSVQFDDAKIRGEIDRALSAIRENGTAERRVLTVSLLGDGKRNVTLSYVVDAPLWKTAYRMVVPEAGKAEGLLQGWAVVENMTASDWDGVDLTLVSGNPVTFKQSLYESYYVDRPEIPVQVFGRIMPRVDQGVVATAAEMEAGQRAEKVLRKSMNAPAPAAAPMMEMDAMSAKEEMAYGGAAPVMMNQMAVADTAMSSVASVANAAQSAEATTQVLFRFPERIDLKSGQSMMVPFVSKSIVMDRVSLYQPDTHPTHPLAAVEIKNDGDTGLPPGVLTLYEQSSLLKGTAFVGDAQLPVLAAGEKRMVSYALDNKVTINREDKSISTEGKVSISQGVVRTAVLNRAETVYTVRGPEKEERVVVIEHPKMGGYEIVSPDPKDVEVTDNYYRVRLPLKAGGKETLSVILESKTWQSYGIDGMPSDMLLAYASGKGELPAETRKVFEKLGAIRREMDAIDQRIYAIDQQRQAIFDDQARTRENIKVLSSSSDAEKKYLKKLSDQEDVIEKIDAEKEKLLKDRADKQKELQELIKDIEI